MVDDFFEKRPRRKIRELNLVPVIDMLTTVIFFLLLSTTFMEYTKLTVPPSKTSVMTETSKELPVAPKIFMGKLGTDSTSPRKILLTWSGKIPGEKAEITQASPAREDIRKASHNLIQAFHTQFPAEKTLQIGLAQGVPYQDLISLMDGVRETIPDLVLISFQEADAMLAQAHAPEHAESAQ